MEEINIKEFIDFYKKYVLGVIIICLVAALGTLIYYMAFKRLSQHLLLII